VPRHDAALLALDAALPSGAVRTDEASRHAYARDESEAAPVLPDAVVMARSTAQVAAVMEVASAHRVPVTPRAAGTGRTGGATCRAGGLVLAFEAFDRIREVDAEDHVAVVEPGVVLGDLRRAVDAARLFYPPDPSSWAECTVGGNVAENAGGPVAFKYGVTGHYVLGLEVVTASGEVLELGRRTKKGVTGYDLTSLVVGSEGTLGLITRATLHLLPAPEAVRTLLVFLDDEARIADAVGATLRTGIVARCIELLDRHTLAVLRDDGLPIPAEAAAMLLVEVDGSEVAVAIDQERVGNALTDAGALEVRLARSEAERERFWSVRRGMSRALRSRAGNKLSEDVVVPRSKLGALFEACRAISAETGVRMPAYGHAGDGNLHVNFLWDDEEEKPRVDRAIEALFRRTLDLGGTLSGEHGIGVLKAPFIGLEQSPGVIDLSQRIKAQWDPQGILNPGKIFAGPGGRPGHGWC
jgi:glycolate oxidase